MRPMLILVLLCSLVQFAIASGIPMPECTNIYSCYAPESCVDVSKPDLNTNQVIRVGNMDVLSTCKALVKIHEYRSNWVYVSMESLVDGISSIVLYQKTPALVEKSKFTCVLNGATIEGKYFELTKFSKVVEPDSKLKCIFDIRKKSSEKVFNPQDSDHVHFEIVTATDTFNTDPTPMMLTKTGCDPSQLVFEKDVETVNAMKNKRSKVYAEIKYEPGKYECENPKIFKKYRKDGSDYTPINDIECKFQFKIDSSPISLGDPIYVRCEADADYFCNNYYVKKKGNYPEQVNSDWSEDVPLPSSLKCPPDQPHLIINSKLILNANTKIKCLNYGNSKFWTVEDDGESLVLTSSGPEVTCTAIVECDRKFKISEKAVPAGRLGADRFPECFATGVLKVNKEKVTHHKCDTSTGDFKYSTGGDYKIVTSDTKFECDYPKNTKVAEEKNAHHAKLMGVGAAVAAGLCSLVAILCFVGSYYFVRWGIRRDEEKKAKMENALLARYCMNKTELAALRAKKNMPADGSDNRPELAEPQWNQMIMSHQYTALNVLGTKDGESASDDPRAIPSVMASTVKFIAGPEPDPPEMPHKLVSKQRRMVKLRQEDFDEAAWNFGLDVMAADQAKADAKAEAEEKKQQ